MKRKAIDFNLAYIMHYNAFLNSILFSKSFLVSMHIIVQRHPDRRAFDNNSSIFFWSHHEVLNYYDFFTLVLYIYRSLYNNNNSKR